MLFQSLAIIFGAKYLLVAVLLIAGIFVLTLPRAKQYQLAKIALISLPLIYVVARVLALFYYDPRPFVVGHFVPLIPHDPDNGFPSDHTLLASAVAALVYPMHRPLGFILWALALLIGTSRIAAGLHSPIDIVGSILIATSIIWATRNILQAYEARKTKTV